MPTDRPQRFIIDNDGNDFCVNMTTDLEGDIQEVISFCPEEVTTYMVCPGARIRGK
jgi:cell wall assembly regulator SMI1